MPRFAIAALALVFACSSTIALAKDPPATTVPVPRTPAG